jgi:hypothetical protein
MDRARRKELIEQYKQRKPDMGAFIIRPKSGGKCHIQSTPDLKGTMNGALARLEGGMHPVKELQKEWNEYGPDHFTMEVLETLAYDEDESKTEYTEELTLLQMIWEEKLTGEGMGLYRKRI